MRREFAHIMFVLPRIVFESLGTMLIFLIFKAVFNHEHIGYLAVISIGLMTASYLLNRRFNSRLLLLVGGIICLAVGFSHGSFTWFFRFIYSAYAFFIWLKGLRLNVEYEDAAVYVRRFFFSSFAMLVLMATVGLGSIFYYVESLSVYFVLYAGSVMLYIGKLNIESIYAEQDANALKGNRQNHYKGVVLNLLIVVLVVLLVASVLISNADLFRSFFEMALRPVGVVGERLGRFLENRIRDVDTDRLSDAMNGMAEATEELYTVSDTRREWGALNVKLIAQITAAAFAVIALVIYGVRLARRKRIVEVENEEYREIRESVFSRRLLYDNTLGRIAEGLKKLFRKAPEEPSLDRIRAAYRKAVRLLIQSGQQLDPSDTPDEMLRKSVLMVEERAVFEQLTEIYKEHRYAPSEPDVIRAEAVLSREFLLAGGDGDGGSAS